MGTLDGIERIGGMMMKYKVGDEVLVKARITSVFSTTYTADCSCGNFYLKNEDILQEPQMTAEEAWKIAKKILLYPDHGGFNSAELEEIFGRTEHLWELTPQEAKAKIEAWEAAKEIKVGDVVTVSVYEGIVTRDVDKYGYCSLLFVDGDIGYYQRSSLKKTGRHIDIEGILKQIGGDE